MMSLSVIPRKIIIFGIVVPLAVIVGYVLASPLEFDSLIVLGLVLGALLLPVFLRWHHPFLIFSWNAALDVVFLPGKPHLWMLMGLISFTLTILARILNKESRLLHVPSITWSLLALCVVVFLTAKFHGGFGLRSLGSNVYGAKKYFFIFLAVVAYFALSAHPIPLERAQFHSGMFFLSGLTVAASNLIYLAGPNFYFLYLIFQVDYAIGKAHEDLMATSSMVKFSRLAGLAPAAQAAYFYMLLRYGLRGIFDFSKPWRGIVCLSAVGLGLLGGFRSSIVLLLLTVGVQIFTERIYRTRLFVSLLLGGVLCLTLLVPFASKLPLSVQRSLSVLPLPIDPAARLDAKASSEWRLQMWRSVLPDVPKYLWFGKGYTASETDYYLSTESFRRGFAKDYEPSLMAGDYHNGPLSLMIPFGIWGPLTFLAFVVAALRVLYLNYRHGNPALERINTFLLTCFLARLIYFLFVFGAIHQDLPFFVGLVGLSISLNAGVCQPKPAPQPVRDDEPIARSRSLALPARLT